MFTPSPSQSLLNAELRMLSAIKTPFTRHQVTGLNTISSLSTFHTNKNVLLIHGWAGGVGIWVNNWDGIFNSKPTNLHAIDLKGWASSSRPKFCGTTPESAQSWWVDSIEEWRVKMDIPKLSIAAHSMVSFS